MSALIPDPWDIDWEPDGRSPEARCEGCGELADLTVGWDGIGDCCEGVLADPRERGAEVHT